MNFSIQDTVAEVSRAFDEAALTDALICGVVRPGYFDGVSVLIPAGAQDWVIDYTCLPAFEKSVKKTVRIEYKDALRAFIDTEDHARFSVFVRPLVYKGQTIGVVCFHAKQDGPGPEETFLSVMAQAFSDAFVRVRVIAEYQADNLSLARRIDALKGMADVINELDLDILLPRIMDLSLSLVNAQVGAVLVIDPQSGKVTSPCEYGLTAQVMQGLCVNGQEALGQVHSGARVLRLNGVNEKVLAGDGLFHISSLLSVPLLSKGTVIGSINIVNSEQGFSQQDEEMLMTISHFAATAVDNALLHKEKVEQERLKEQIQIARAIQRRLLPAVEPSIPGLDIAAMCVSCDETSGDYYDFIQRGSKTEFIIADVTGHGLGAALYMTACRAFLRAFTGAGLEPLKVVEELNKVLCKDMEDDKFVTFLMMGIDHRERECRFVCAGHEAPLLYHAASDCFTQMEAGSLPLGMLDTMTWEESGIFTIETGDVLLLCTDGVFETMNSNAEQYGIDRLKQCIRSNAGQDARRILTILYEEVKAFCYPDTPKDDITAVIIKGV